MLFTVLPRGFIGTIPALNVFDEDMLSEIYVKQFDTFTNRMVGRFIMTLYKYNCISHFVGEGCAPELNVGGYCYPVHSDIDC